MNNYKIFTKNIESEAYTQIKDISILEEFENSKIRIMPDCLTEDSEVLCNDGTYKLITELKGDEYIANYNPKSGKIFFTPPKSIIIREQKPNEIFYEFGNTQNNFRFYTNSKHRMAIKNNMGIKAELVNNITIKDLIFNGNGVEASINKYDDNLIRLVAWIVGDGSIKKTINTRTINYRIRFGVKKERKIQRIIYLLNQLKLQYTISKYERGDTTITINTKSSKALIDLVGLDKQYPKEFLFLSKQQSIIFKDELIQVDGDFQNQSYRIYSANLQQVDFLSAFFTINFGLTRVRVKKQGKGCFKTNKTQYYISLVEEHLLNYSKSGIHNRKIYKKQIKYSGKVCCVECDSSYFIVRQNGFNFITGNCHAGKGCVIGFTATLTDRIIPNLIGVDIGCFTGDTKVALLSGVNKSLKELYESKEKIWVYAINENKKIVPAEAIALQTRKNAELLEVIVSGGYNIKCTPDHKFMLLDGSYREAKDLKPSDSLMPLYRTYQTRDGYESCNNGVGKQQLTHIMVAKKILGDTKNKVVHHKNLNWYDNRPENLQILTAREHSSLHRKLNPMFNKEEFKIKRKATLDKNGYYDISKYVIKKETALKNLEKVFASGKWVQVSKEAGQRNKEHIIKYNQINNSTEFSCKKCGRKIKGKGGLVRHEEHCNNHKVLSVRKLNYTEDVYCLNVPMYNNFALEAGIFVHNCGMLLTKLGNIEIDFDKLDKVIREYVPSGKSIHKNSIYNFNKLTELKCYKELKYKENFNKSIGTLGGGNHFIEIDIDNKDNKYLIIHSGSRNLGKQICDYYQNIAVEQNSFPNYENERQAIIDKYKKNNKTKDIQKELDKLKDIFIQKQKLVNRDICSLSGIYKENYLHDMKIAQEYAVLNREMIAKTIMKYMNWWDNEHYESVHNYINFKDNIIRKGAISAHKDEKVIIPLNMRDGVILGIGKENEDWNYSAPHGAGRIMSRGKAKAQLNLKTFKESMKDVYSTTVNQGTLDESPEAYKPAQDIIEAIKDTVNIINIIKPIYNYKSSE